jgi:RNA polymerase primary sigma factor
MDADELRKLLREAGFDVEREPDETTLVSTVAWSEPGEQLGLEELEASGSEGPSAGAALLRRPIDRAATGEDTPQTSAAMYFRDISSVGLLTAEEEIALAQQIERGEDAKRFLSHSDHLSPERIDQLQQEVDHGEASRRRLTESNLRLVVSVARKYLNRGLPMLDLIQEGNIGLARAVEKYDWRKGYRFSTYAYWWIRQGITRAIADQARTIRVPIHMVSAIGDVYKTWRDLQQELGREPKMGEVAQRLGVTPDKVRDIMQASRQPVSLETPLGDEGSSTLGDLITDHSVGSPHDLAANAMLKRHMDDAMQVLSDRERKVLRLRYGMEGGRDHTLGEIADMLGVSSERIRQIEASALGKLRQPKLRHKLREYLNDYVA